MCKSVSVKSAVQILAVGGAKNGSRGLEKNPTCKKQDLIHMNEISRLLRKLLLHLGQNKHSRKL
jgi:hypothetical protein